jgi:DNA-binding transcriptional LysR family regulator
MDDRLAPDWNQLRALLATVETGSLSAAARQLGLTQPTLGRQVAALEKSLGVILFERAGRGLVLTQAGREVVAPLGAMHEAAERVGRIASFQSGAMEGVVRITASNVYAAYILPPVLEKIRSQAPGIVIDIVASNAVEDLIRRRADIALRHVPPVEPELIARRCPDATARLYGTARYLDRIGRPERAEDLLKADFIGFSDNNTALIAELNRRGIAVEARHFPIISADVMVAWQFVQAGLGLGTMMQPVAAATPLVEDAWPGFAGVPVPLWLTTHRELRTSRRIRLVFDLLAAELAG